ncbi:unnamed protein product [Rotaria sp. Silwood1]|nr:unnamed protein product [Rotaria sp. Silwood1]
MKQWSTKNTNYLTATKRVEYDLPPKFISNANITFKIDESIISKEEAQIVYDQLRQLTQEYRIQAMSLYLQAITREKEILKNEIEFVVKGFSQENDEGFDIEPDAGYTAYKHYNDLCEKRFNLEAEQSIYFLDEQRVEGEEEYQLLKLGPRFIYNDPQTASRRRTTELAMLKRKLQDYHKKSDEYMEETEAYKCLHQNDPLSSLIVRTNKYLLNLRLTNWIT